MVRVEGFLRETGEHRRRARADTGMHRINGEATKSRPRVVAKPKVGIGPITCARFKIDIGR